ncbi:permease-like cell division protein FtsX [Solibacillus sp. FSL H8-0523]|uniref:cell division protein FtsX n=1 Tax=Solibacillus sp. FSL H8-0523 TaxID=2954511 RepID=UPI003100E948
MNKHQISYMLEDTKLGIKRNRGSVIASVTLLFIALSLIGSILLVRAYIGEAVDYVESQLAMKVYVEDGMAEEVAAIIAKQSYAKDVQIESGEQIIQNLAFFFEGREHLLEAFTDGSMPDAVKFQVRDTRYFELLAQNLQQVEGIQKVVYPQQMAKILTDWLYKIELYGVLAIILFIAVAFLMVYSSFHLAMYQRSKELKIKLFLGMNPKIVRLQFLIEGFVLGLFGAVLGMAVVVMLYTFLIKSIQEAIPYLGQLNMQQVIVICTIQLGMGLLLGVVASYVSTRKLIRYV